jgi:replication factor C subunit 2/4
MQKNVSTLWVEKYRPQTLNDICSQNNVIEILKSVLIKKNMPHLIFYGPSGSGKTSTILSLANDLFGNEYKNRIIEMNASDERGINIIREKIKLYAKQLTNTSNNNIPWKIIILDEADTMTTDSQYALRRIIEQYSKITRFCIICNYFNKIIDPIVSRCSIFRFKSISNDEIYKRISYISLQEKMNCNNEFINKIVQLSKGDLRRAINLLQSCRNNKDIAIEEYFDDLLGIIPKSVFNNIIKSIENKDVDNIDKMINYIYQNGYSIINQMNIFHNYIINLPIDNKKKHILLTKLINIDQNISKGCYEYIQLHSLLYMLLI